MRLMFIYAIVPGNDVIVNELTTTYFLIVINPF